MCQHGCFQVEGRSQLHTVLSIPLFEWCMVGVAGHVATTGEVLIIPNAYEDPRFNSAVDKQTGGCKGSTLPLP